MATIASTTFGFVPCTYAVIEDNDFDVIRTFAMANNIAYSDIDLFEFVSEVADERSCDFDGATNGKIYALAECADAIANGSADAADRLQRWFATYQA